MRFVIAALVALVSALLLVGVLRSPALRGQATEVPSDELLAYSIAPNAGVTLGLLAQTDEIRLTSWCVVGKALPEERFDYGLEVQWQDTVGRALGQSQLAFESRVSQSTSSMTPASFVARLAYSDALVTDSRTVRVFVPRFEGRRPSRLHLLSVADQSRRLLVRATFPDRRQPLEIAAADRRLSATERLELVRDRTSVDYDELPFELRAMALATWQRRLDAAGLEGKDYRVERLLIGTGRTSSGLALAQRPTWSVHHRHSLAFNVRAPVRLRVSTKAHTTLLVATSVEGQTKPLVVDEGGRLDLDVGLPTSAQTIVIASTSESPVPVQVSAVPDQMAAVLGPAQPLEDSERYAVSPQLRRNGYYRLDPMEPVSLQLARGQTFLGVTVRSTHTQPRGRIEANIDGEAAAIDVALVPSVFEQWADEAPATDGLRLFLRIPAGARQLELRGSAHLWVSPFTTDPEVSTDRVAPEFEVPLPPETHWKYARYDIARDVSVQPQNEETLVAAKRKQELIAQSRIVGFERARQQPEAALVPTTTTVQRHVIEPVRWGPEIPLPEDVVIALERPHRGYVPASGPRAGHVRVSYRLDPSDVGADLALLVDNSAVHSEPTIASSGQFDVPVTSGMHGFSLQGLAGASQILLDATPLEAAGALRRRVVYRIAPAAILRFVIRKQVDVANVVVTSYLQNERRVALKYAIEGSQQSDFMHAATALHGEITGIATEASGVWYWETGPTQRLNQHRGVVRLGNDLSPGIVALVLRNLSPTPVFVALVLVGQDSSSRPALQRFWTTEVP